MCCIGAPLTRVLFLLRSMDGRPAASPLARQQTNEDLASWQVTDWLWQWESWLKSQYA